MSGVPNTNQQQRQDPAQTARPPPARGDQLCQEKFSAVRLSVKWRTPENGTASYASAPSLSIESYLYSPNITGPIMGLASVKHRVSLHHGTQPEISALGPLVQPGHVDPCHVYRFIYFKIIYFFLKSLHIIYQIPSLRVQGTPWQGRQKECKRQRVGWTPRKQAL